MTFRGKPNEITRRFLSFLNYDLQRDDYGNNQVSITPKSSKLMGKNCNVNSTPLIKSKRNHSFDQVTEQFKNFFFLNNDGFQKIKQ